MARKEELKVSLTAVDKLSDVVEDAAKAVDKLDGEEAEVEVTADTDKAEQAVEDVTKALDKLDGETAEAKITTNDAEAEAEIDAIMARLRDLDDEEIIAVLSAKATKLEAEVKQANALLANFDGEDATAILNVKDEASAKLRAVNSRLDDLRGGFRNVKTEGTQSRSVLANLAGNSAQDIGELGGVVGSLGVGLGQLAEYAVDGNIKLKELAKVAGPMTALSVGLVLIQTAISGIRADKAFRAELVENFTDALREGLSVAESLRDTVEETGELELSDDGVFGLGARIRDIIPTMNLLGLGLEDFQRLVDDAMSGGEDSVNAFFDAMEESLGVTEREQSAVDDVRDAVFQYADAATKAATAQEQLDEFLSGSATSMDDINVAMDEAAVASGRLEGLWSTLMRDLEDGAVSTDAGTEAWNQLREILGKTDQEMTELVNQKLDEMLEDQAHAGEGGTAAIGGLGDRTRTTIDNFSSGDSAAAEFSSALAGMASEADDTTSHVDTLTDSIDRLLGRLLDETPTDRARSAYREVNAAVDDFGEGMQQAAEDGLTLAEAFDVSTEAGRANEERLERARDAIEANSVAMVQNGSSAEEASQSLDYFTGVVRDHMLSVQGDDAAVDGLISTYFRVPDDVKTDLRLLGLNQAQADIATHKSRLGSIPGSISTAVNVQAFGIANVASALAALTQSRTVKVYVDYRGDLSGKRAAGGPVTADQLYEVGERGPELFVPDSNGRIIPAHQTAAYLGHLNSASSFGSPVAAGMVAGDTHVTINMPTGSNGQDVLNALQREQRRRGVLPLRVAAVG